MRVRAVLRFVALGSRSTAASWSRLVDENGPAASTGGRERESTWQPQLVAWLVVVCSARRPARVVRGLLRAFLYLSIYLSIYLSTIYHTPGSQGRGSLQPLNRTDVVTDERERAARTGCVHEKWSYSVDFFADTLFTLARADGLDAADHLLCEGAVCTALEVCTRVCDRILRRGATPHRSGVAQSTEREL